jgi:hypothetical protein
MRTSVVGAAAFDSRSLWLAILCRPRPGQTDKTALLHAKRIVALDEKQCFAWKAGKAVALSLIGGAVCGVIKLVELVRATPGTDPY